MTKEATISKSRATAGTIRITLPAKVAYSPDRLKESIAGLMERIGCPKCFSGADCFFQNERRFVLDAKLALEARPAPATSVRFASDPDGDPARTYSVGFSESVRYDINKVFRAVDKVIDIIGHHPCISGFDFLFKDVLQSVVVNDEIQGQVFDQRF